MTDGQQVSTIAQCGKQAGGIRRTRPLSIGVAALVLGLGPPLPARTACAQAAPQEPAVTPAAVAAASEPEPNFTRAMLELSGVMAIGFIWYLTEANRSHDYNVGYSWPIFRKKLLGEAFELDDSGFNTNFVGHPVGGTLYYMTARSNHLSIAESSALAVGGAVFWEFFGEVHEIVSANDVTTTPLAGISIGESASQLGSFFDRSSPTLSHRIFGVVFAPLQSLNDALDGRHPARDLPLDEHGYPRDEWHQFDLSLGGARTVQAAPASGWARDTSQELRISLASSLVRIPGYDGVSDRVVGFTDANASTLRIDASLTRAGLVDLDIDTQVAMVGIAVRQATGSADGEVYGNGGLLGITMGFQYVLHDYDRDGFRPKDGISTVQPLGLLLEHRLALGPFRAVTRVTGGGDFGGLRPYARAQYLERPHPALPTVLAKDDYVFVVGAHLIANTALSAGPFELSGRLRYERYNGVHLPFHADDRALLLGGGASVSLGAFPARLSVLLERRLRAGRMADVRAERSETSLGFEIGTRY